MSKTFAGFLMLASACVCLMSTVFLFQNWHVKPSQAIPLRFNLLHLHGLPWMQVKSVHLGLLVYHCSVVVLTLVIWYSALKAVSTFFDFDEDMIPDPLETSRLVVQPGRPTSGQVVVKTIDYKYLFLALLLAFVLLVVLYLEHAAFAIAEGRTHKLKTWLIWAGFVAMVPAVFLLAFIRSSDRNRTKVVRLNPQSLSSTV